MLLVFILGELFQKVELTLQPLSTAFGNKFLLTLPRMISSSSTATLFLYSPVNSSVSVYLSVLSHNTSSNLTAVIKASRVTIVRPHSIYNTDLDVGKKFTFAFNGNNTFGMSVQICQDVHYLDMYTVLPVAAWGMKYIVVTLRKNPTLQIINSMAKNEITLTFKKPILEEIQYFTQGVGYVLKLLLRSFQSYSISKCDDNVGSMTGTIIESSSPVGVITGSCLSDTEFLICNTSKVEKGKKGTFNTASEMLLPYETYGTEFISFNIVGRLSQGLVAVVASKNNTEVKLYTNNNGTTFSVFLQQTGDWVYLPVSGFNYYFKADKAIQVIYEHRSVCWNEKGVINEKDQGGPSLGLLVPMELFYDHFIWSTPFTEGNASFSNYATYVTDANNIPYIRLDHNPLNITNWQNVIGQPDYKVGSLQVSKGLHTTFVITTSKFVCYVYGFADNVSYMLGPNFISSPINLPCTRSVTFMMPGDLRDNDCDFFVDEEAFDNIDNDADGSIDEDLGLPNRECQLGYWGQFCRNECSNCEMDCDRHTGACLQCKPGFKNPETGCQLGCGEYEYGRNCIGDCKLKCRSDCVERRHGTCPSYSSVAVTWVAVTAIMALSVPLCFLCLAMFSEKDKSFHDAENEPENVVVYAAITTTGSGLSSLNKGRTSIGSSIN